MPFSISHLFQSIIKAIQRIQGKQKTFHFLHVGKTGGTAIKYALKNAPANSRCTIYLHDHNFRLKDAPNGEGVIFCLRDPISRFLSGFYARQREDKPRYFNVWTPKEKKAFEFFKTPNDLAIALSSLDEEKKRRAQEAMRSISHVRNSYWDWFESEDYLRHRFPDIFFICRQEFLEEDFDTLKSKIGLPASVKLPDDDIKAHRNPNRLISRSLKEEAIDNLKLWYKRDYIFVSLCEKILERQILDSGKILRPRFL